MIAQIYEIQTPEEAEGCVAAGVHQIGSVLLSEAEWKNPSVKAVGTLSRSGGSKHSIIPLFRSEELIYRVIEYHQPDLIHFCDNASDGTTIAGDIGSMIELQGRVKERFPQVAIMRAIPIPAQDLSFPEFPWEAIAKAFEPVSDVFLIDTWVPAHLTPVPDFVGITGKLPKRDWCRALVKQAGIPVILAGGLSPENVYDAVLDAVPAGADSCTQTNRFDASGKPIRFVKDMRKVSRFVAEVDRARRDLGTDRESIKN